MSLVKERNNATNIIRYYDIKIVKSNADVVNWISSIREFEGLTIDYIYYSDLVNRSDEGSGNIQIDAQASVDTLNYELQKRDVDMISINGSFYTKPVVIGIDLRNYLVCLTIRKRTPANVELLEKVLNLL